MAKPTHEPVVVIGLGRFGSALALELTRGGTDVLAIDSRSQPVQALSGQLTQAAVADSTDIEALRQLGVAEYQRAVVAIGTDQEASILTTSQLVDMGIPNIWAKAISRQHGRILERLGAHHVVLPEHDMGERVAHMLSGRILDYVELDEDFAMVKTTPPHPTTSSAYRWAKPAYANGSASPSSQSNPKPHQAPTPPSPTPPPTPSSATATKSSSSAKSPTSNASLNPSDRDFPRRPTAQAMGRTAVTYSAGTPKEPSRMPR